MMCGFARMKYLNSVMACGPDKNISLGQGERTILKGDVDLADRIAFGELTELTQEQLPFLYGRGVISVIRKYHVVRDDDREAQNI